MRIRSDGIHPDVDPLAELARDVYVAELIEATSQVRAELAAAAVMDG